MTKNILELASEFEALTKNAAGGMNRKQVAKALETAKKEYLKHKERHDSSSSQHEALTKDIADANDKMLAARKDVLKHHDLLRGMDLSGVDEIKMKDDDISYIKDKKEFSAQFDNDGNCTLTPKQKIKLEKKKDKEEPKEEEEFDFDFFK